MIANRDHFEGPCAVWEGEVDRSGYGRAFHEGRKIGAHRAAWLSAGRTIPRGHQIHHKCRNKLCTNVDHLECLSLEDHGSRHSGEIVLLRTVRENCGLSLRDVEERSGISRGILSMIETGRMNATDDEVAAIAQALEVTGTFRTLIIPVYEALDPGEPEADA